MTKQDPLKRAYEQWLYDLAYRYFCGAITEREHYLTRVKEAHQKYRKLVEEQDK